MKAEVLRFDSRRRQEIFILKSIETGSLLHPASYSMDTESHSPLGGRGKEMWPESEAGQSLASRVEVKKSEL